MIFLLAITVFFNFVMIQYTLVKLNQMNAKVKELAWKVGRTDA